MKTYFHAPSTVDIIDAAQRGDVAKVKLLLAKDPLQARVSDSTGYSPFHWAAYSDDLEVFEVLAHSITDYLTLRTLKGLTCLHVACSTGSIRVVRRILEHVCNSIGDINKVNNFHETALHLAAAAHLTEIVDLLLIRGADPKIKDKWGRTPHKVSYKPTYV